MRAATDNEVDRLLARYSPAGWERIERLARRVQRRAMRHHMDDDGGGATYDPMMEAVEDLGIALGGRVPPRRLRRPERVESVIDASRRLAREEREGDGA